MNNITEILTKVYGYVNRIKVNLAYGNIAGAWDIINELSGYLVSIDVSPTQPEEPKELPHE